MSDLHLEFGGLGDPDPADILVLAGDITTNNNVDWINRQAQRFTNVIYVFGNHEHYKQYIEGAYRKTINKLLSNVHILNNESVNIEGITFHGTTLWADFNKGDYLTYFDANRFMNDFKQIRWNNGKHRFTAETAHREHNIAKLFLMDNIKEGDFVITHHGPTRMSTPERYKTDRLNGAYVSDLSELILDTKPSYWVHGHIHHTFDYEVGDTRVLCNPRGYDGHELNPDFNINAEIVIES